MDRIRQFTEENRRSWDRFAAERKPQSLEFFRSGETTLEPYDIELLPDVRGKRLLHLACATGNESMSWAARGALVTAIDISDVGLEVARAHASALNLDIEFVTADMFDLPDRIGQFDVVFASSGVICWVPDINRWAQIVEQHLAPGGSLLLAEHHPVWEILGVRGSDRLEATVDYFGRERPTPGKYDQAKLPTGAIPGMPLSTFVWPVTDVLMSLIKVGLTIDHVSEHSHAEMYRNLEESQAQLLPAIYVIKATKTR